jgi:hypothetical protein
MPGRVVVQWDKDDCADLGIIKVDLLGLGMMAALEEAIALCQAAGRPVDLAHLPPDDPAVYRLLQEADTVGLFQVESRAQMATLPRLRPRRFYDLVVQIAIIRPGPIIGQMVHPYLARRAGRQHVAYPHPSLEPILRRTLGVPLFQEQLLRMGMVAAGLTGGEAEELRRAFGFRRSRARMQAIETKLRAGIARNGITGPSAEEIVRAITAFAEYGFPECVGGDTRVLDAATGPGCRSRTSSRGAGPSHARWRAIGSSGSSVGESSRPPRAAAGESTGFAPPSGTSWSPPGSTYSSRWKAGGRSVRSGSATPWRRPEPSHPWAAGAGPDTP